VPAVVPEDPTKALLDSALAPVAADLKELNARLVGFLPSESLAAKRVLSHVFDGTGKRIRPALYFMCCHLLGYRGEYYYPIGAVAEFVHTASLLHDDVVDNSSLRRNKPTPNSIYGDETSVLVGDLIYSRASEIMAATGNMEIVKTFARAIRLMSDGELLQLENLFNPAMPEAAYFRILECKTAILIAAACKSAGLLAGAADGQVKQLERFGHCVGMAFQLIDDALDYTGAAALIGKATLSDLTEGKVTLPVILLHQRATAAERARLAELVKGEPVSPEAVREVASLVEKYETAEATVAKAEAYTHEAMACLASFEPSRERDVLANLADKLLFRFN
jgi:octaprenyl-diphosphate synthase